MAPPSVSLWTRASALAFALLWSSGFIVAKYASADADPFTFLVVRFAASFLLLGLLAFATRAPWPAHLGDAAHSIVAGVLLHGGYLAGVWWAIARGLPAGIAGLITGAQPLLTAVLAVPLLHERIAFRQWCGILIGFAGIIMVLAPRLSAVDVSSLNLLVLPIAATVAATLSVTLGSFYQKRFAAAADLRTGTALQFIGGLAAVGPLALATESLRLDMTAALVGSLAWSVLGVSIAAIVLLMLLIRHGAVSRVAALIYLVPPLTALEAYILFGEKLSPVQVVGMAITVSGVWLATRITAPRSASA
ncbi:MAG: DMT family transporter [Xanthobacteraceae bacterium]